MKTTLARPWLMADLGEPQRVLSWSLNRPGFVTSRRIVWREVRDADLPENFDADAWFAAELAQVGEEDAVGFLTSRDVTRFTTGHAEVEGVEAAAVATIGLSNAERVGSVRRADFAIGTINIAVSVSTGLTEAAIIETLSVATAARTAAIMSHGPMLASGRATGTGTDCLAVAAPPGTARHAGLHTAIGEAVGRAVYDAVATGAQNWMKEQEG
ncbi:MAG: adenosylcobinamide amidohydrolase [Pseudomonadota bacterium]